MNVKGIGYTVLSAVLFGITPLLARCVYEYGATPITVVFFRSLFVLPILWIIMRVQKVSLRISSHDLKNIGVISIFGSGLTTILLFSSYMYIDVGTATTLHFLYPVFVSILCFFIYHDALSKAKLCALGIACLGTLCFFFDSKGGQPIGFILAIVSALTYAFYMVQMEKTRLAHDNAYRVSFYISAFVVLETIMYHIVTPSIHLQLPLPAYGYLLLLGIVSSFLAVVLLQLGIKLLGSSTASLFCLFEPITSVIAGVLWLQESLSFWKVIGCLVIFSALILITSYEKKKISDIPMTNQQTKDFKN